MSADHRVRRQRISIVHAGSDVSIAANYPPGGSSGPAMRTKDSGFGRPRHENFDYPANSATARVRWRLRRRGVNRTQLSRHCDRDPHNDAGPVNNDDHNDNHNVRVAVIHSPGTTQPAVATVVGTVAAVLSPRTAARSAQTAGAVALLALHFRRHRIRCDFCPPQSDNLSAAAKTSPPLSLRGGQAGTCPRHRERREFGDRATRAPTRYAPIRQLFGGGPPRRTTDECG
jgi:hypothetical protein